MSKMSYLVPDSFGIYARNLYQDGRIAEALALMIIEWEPEILLTEFETQLQNIAETVEDLWTKIGDVFLPVFQDVANSLIDLSNTIGFSTQEIKY